LMIGRDVVKSSISGDYNIRDFADYNFYINV
jgi:hypothetical protein